MDGDEETDGRAGPEFFGEEEPVPLTDVWPGLEEYLPPHRKECRLVRCERIPVRGEEKGCVVHNSNVYIWETLVDRQELDGNEDEIDAILISVGPHRLQRVVEELKLGLNPEEIKKIHLHKTPAEVEELRAAIRWLPTDAERLLEAVGREGLRYHLPASLLGVLKRDNPGIEDLHLAEAAISAWGADVLKHCKIWLDRLDPPPTRAGSAKVVEFVRALGFPEDWAGERGKKPDPFLEVEGPRPLPRLHAYQRTIADNVRKLLRGEYGAERRGMIGMPTGSGKTRVAVQAVVEAMRDGGFRGGVLWVADRDELCEQEVEAWRQVWSSEGARASRLRVSRMWARPTAAAADDRAPCRRRHRPDARIEALESARAVRIPGGFQARRVRRSASVHRPDLYFGHAGSRFDELAEGG